MPPYCSKCRQEGHILAKCPQKDNHKPQWTHSFLTQTTSVSTVVAITDQLFAPHGLNINQPQVLQVMYPMQVSHTVICLLNRVPRTVNSMYHDADPLGQQPCTNPRAQNR